MSASSEVGRGRRAPRARNGGDGGGAPAPAAARHQPAAGAGAPDAVPAPAAAARATDGRTAKSAKFRELAAARVNKAVDAIRVIGNLSNPSAYEYTEAEVASMLAEIRAATDDLAERFSPLRGRKRAPFSF